MDNSVGKRIETLRKSKKISQEDLAEKVGVSRTTIYKWESGTSVPNYANMQALARALETTVSFFTDETSFGCDEEEKEKESARENEIALSVGNKLCAADITYETPAEEAYCDKPKLQWNSGDNDGKKGGGAKLLAAAILSLIGCIIFSAISSCRSHTCIISQNSIANRFWNICLYFILAVYLFKPIFTHFIFQSSGKIYTAKHKYQSSDKPNE